MPRCCGGATCSCVIQGSGTHIEVSGSGSPGDPFIIAADVALQAKDNTTFDVAVTGLGTTTVPWEVEVKYASSAKLNDLPDVTAPAPSNGQVLGWDSATSQWTNRAPTTAASGSVQHDTALTGDGSAGSPLGINEDPARMLGTAAGGLGLSDAGMNSIVRRFADSAARNAASPAPALNSVSMLDSAPGKLDYWDGDSWEAAGMFMLAATGQEMYQLSGAYTGTQRLTWMVRNVSQITDTSGVFDAIPAVDLAGRGGVLTAMVQATGVVGSIPSPFTVMLAPQAGALKGIAYRLVDGQPMPTLSITCTVLALLY